MELGGVRDGRQVCVVFSLYGEDQERIAVEIEFIFFYLFILFILFMFFDNVFYASTPSLSAKDFHRPT